MVEALNRFCGGHHLQENTVVEKGILRRESEMSTVNLGEGTIYIY